MHIRGGRQGQLNLSPLLSPEFDSYVLFPTPDAIEVDKLRLNKSKPVQLIVSDGNWRQAGKINTRHPELQHLPRIKVRPPNQAGHHLRKEHFTEGLSTLEAIALALMVIEDESVSERLMALYRAKLRATLKGRGLAEVPPARPPSALMATL